MTTLSFTLPDGSRREVAVRRTLNAGYAGRDSAAVQAHIDELAELGVPGPSTVPTLYPISTYLAQQVDLVEVQHARTSGEAEWALVIDDDGEALLTAACDHTDRALEVHGVAWSKNASPDVLADRAWRLADVRDHLDQISLRAWVSHGEGAEELISDSSCADLLTPDHWLQVLAERGLADPGTVLMSGTVLMIEGVDQFADRWRVQLADPVTDETIEVGYAVRQLPEPIE